MHRNLSNFFLGLKNIEPNPENLPLVREIGLQCACADRLAVDWVPRFLAPPELRWLYDRSHPDYDQSVPLPPGVPSRRSILSG